MGKINSEKSIEYFLDEILSDRFYSNNITIKAVIEIMQKAKVEYKRAAANQLLQVYKKRNKK